MPMVAVFLIYWSPTLGCDKFNRKIACLGAEIASGRYVSTPVTKTDIRAINRGISDQTDLTHAPTAPKDGETIARTLGIGSYASTATSRFSAPPLQHLYPTTCTQPRAPLISNPVQILGFCLFFLSILTLTSGVVIIYEKPEHAHASSATVRPRATKREAKASDAHVLVHKEVRYTKGEESRSEQEDGAEGESVTLRTRGVTRPTSTRRNSKDVLSALASIANMREMQAGVKKKGSAG
ncbi:hypothetical protein FIBSPDRAFT_1014074 [Athelia psychrophila]|uniref:Uncharacterized protein n=1 Tax=Athelia psychrophila TaxID=1759441 RepID=A0A166M293_9AGAM|nr:hypothetical protein FIBSPDRAFT_1014074 [Fibularhizoctonia sp. CBS 109695]